MNGTDWSTPHQESRDDGASPSTILRSWHMPAVAMLVIAITVVACVTIYFSPKVLQRQESPDDRYVAEVMERNAVFGYVAVAVRVIRKGGGTLETRLGGADLWQDISNESYRVTWVGNERFEIGDLKRNRPGQIVTIRWPDQLIVERER